MPLPILEQGVHYAMCKSLYRLIKLDVEVKSTHMVVCWNKGTRKHQCIECIKTGRAKRKFWCIQGSTIFYANLCAGAPRDITLKTAISKIQARKHSQETQYPNRTSILVTVHTAAISKLTCYQFSLSHLHPTKTVKLQKEVTSTQKQPSCKKGLPHAKWNVWKQLFNSSQCLRIDCDGKLMAKN